MDFHYNQKTVITGDALLRDIKRAIRTLSRDSIFSVIAVLMLALGVGTNLTVFEVMHRLFRSLPVSHPEQIVRIVLSLSGEDIPFSGPMFDALQENRKAIRQVMAWAPLETYIDEDEGSYPIDGALISGNGFLLLGLEAELGRLLNSDDDKPGGGPNGFAAVISDGFWRNHFGRSSTVLDRRLVVNGIPLTIVGVMPPKFNGMTAGSSPEIVMPLEFEVRSSGKLSQRHFAGSTWLTVFGRREADFPFNAAVAQLQTFEKSVLKEGLATIDGSTQRELLPRLKLRMYPGQNGGSEDASFRGGSLRDVYRQPIVAVQWLAGFLLLLCIVNLVALQFARRRSREHDFAVRLSLGAGYYRIWRQLLIENLLIGIVGSITAILVERGLSIALARLLASQQEYWLLATDMDSTLLLVGSVLGVGCMIFSGIPAMVFWRGGDLAYSLKANGPTRSTLGRAARRSGRLLISVQVSACMVLLVASGLFLSTLFRLLSVHMGFNPQGVVLFPFNASSDTAGRIGAKALEMKVVERLRSTPAVSAASLLSVPPIGGGLPTTVVQSIESVTKTDRQLPINEIGPDYLALMRTRLLEGREFSSVDTQSSPAVCMISSSAARYFFSGRSPLGKRLLMPPPRPPSVSEACEIVGIAEDAKFNDLRSISPRLIYLNAAQLATPVRYIVVKTRNVPETTRAFRRILHEESPATRVSTPKVLSDQINNSIGRERLIGAVSTVLATLAVFVTGAGLYGFLAWSVARRSSEIGIRMALGAMASTVIWMISRETLVFLALGVGAGSIASYLLTKLVTGMLYATSPADPGVLCGTVIILFLLGIVATWLPARRAALLDPTMALRSE